MTAPIPTSSQDALQNLRARLGDRYAIERELGRGGMGAVYLARDIKLDRLVALKVLPPEFAVQATLRDRFLRETRTAASFSHPNIVPVYAVEESDDFLAYAMGYIEGESLMERVRRAGPLTVRETVRMMQDVAYALAYAHGRGIVHRDIKPDNIMIDRGSGRALVMDFGIARASSNVPAASRAGLTRVGEVVGTPEYMSPEQASGDDVDGRSDLYSLGLTIMFAVTGKIAFTADTTQKVLVKQLTETLPPVATLRSDLPSALAGAMDRCVMKNPADRFDTAEGLVDALDSSQLITVEVPLAIRLFQQEASTLTVLILSFLFAAIYIGRSSDMANGVDDTKLFVVTFFAVVVTRIMQTMREAQRLAVAGFSAQDISAGLTRVMDEREARRSELRADPIVVRTRRRTVAIGLVMLAVAAVSFKVALHFRIQVRPGYYQVGLWGSVFVVMSLFSLGVGAVLLLKSPLRMPVTERIFRGLWLGPMGTGFVRFAGRNVARQRATNSSAGVMTPAIRSGAVKTNVTQVPVDDALVPEMVSVQSDAPVAERLAAIERRLTRLEGR